MATDKKHWYKRFPGWAIGYIAVVAFLFGTGPGAAVWRLLQAQYGAIRNRAQRAARWYGLKQFVTALLAIAFFFFQSGPWHNLLGSACLLVLGIEVVFFMLILNGLARGGSVLKRAIGGVARALYMVFFIVPPVVVALTIHPWNWFAFALFWYSILAMGAMYGILMGVISLAWFRWTQFAVIVIIVAHFVILTVPSLSASFRNNRAKNERRAILINNETALLKKDKANVAKWTPCTVRIATAVMDLNRKVVGKIKPDSLFAVCLTDTLATADNNPTLVRMCPATPDGNPLPSNDKKYIYPNMHNIVIGWNLLDSSVGVSKGRYEYPLMGLNWPTGTIVQVLNPNKKSFLVATDSGEKFYIDGEPDRLLELGYPAKNIYIRAQGVTDLVSPSVKNKTIIIT